MGSKLWLGFVLLASICVGTFGAVIFQTKKFGYPFNLSEELESSILDTSELSLELTTKFNRSFREYIEQGNIIDRNNPLEMAFRKWDIIPKIMTVPPTKKLKVVYEWGEMEPGTEITEENITMVAKKPRVEWHGNSSAYHTLFLAAITSFNAFRDVVGTTEYVYFPEWHQWVVVNIPGMDVDKGMNIYDYVPPKPPDFLNTTDAYAFLIYEQPEFKKFYQTTMYGNTTPYYQFCELSPLRYFTDNYILGDPIWGNYFIVTTKTNNPLYVR